MQLTTVELNVGNVALPGEVRTLIEEAERRIERFQSSICLPAFVPCDFSGAYAAIRALFSAGIEPGSRFCEWGSGFGVVTCLAAMLEFDACGIEIERDLVDAARELADDFNLPVEFLHGSFIPDDDVSRAEADDCAWLSLDTAGSYADLDLAPDDLDIVFAYPWPDEEWFTEHLFLRHAAVGALLLTYHGGEEFRLRRKIARRGERKKRR